MKKRKRIKIAIGVVAFIVMLGLIKFFYFPVLYPTRSSAHKLTLVKYSGFYPNSIKITLKHYVMDELVREHILEIKEGVHDREPQTYELPEFTEGTVEVCIELSESIDSEFTVLYTDAKSLYKEGLLFYLTTNDSEYKFVNMVEYYDRYVYFVSGGHTVCYFRDAYVEEWHTILDAPPLKTIPAKVHIYLPWYSGWKENEWKVVEHKN